MKIDVREDILTIEMSGDLVASVVRKNLEIAKDSIENNHSFKGVALDLSNVENIDSIGITFIVGLYKTALEHDKDFKVTGVNENIDHLFRLMSLDEVFLYE